MAKKPRTQSDEESKKRERARVNYSQTLADTKSDFIQGAKSIAEKAIPVVQKSGSNLNYELKKRDKINEFQKMSSYDRNAVYTDDQFSEDLDRIDLGMYSANTKNIFSLMNNLDGRYLNDKLYGNFYNRVDEREWERKQLIDFFNKYDPEYKSAEAQDFLMDDIFVDDLKSKFDSQHKLSNSFDNVHSYYAAQEYSKPEYSDYSNWIRKINDLYQEQHTNTDKLRQWEIRNALDMAGDAIVFNDDLIRQMEENENFRKHFEDNYLNRQLKEGKWFRDAQKSGSDAYNSAQSRLDKLEALKAFYSDRRYMTRPDFENSFDIRSEQFTSGDGGKLLHMPENLSKNIYNAVNYGVTPNVPDEAYVPVDPSDSQKSQISNYNTIEHYFIDENFDKYKYLTDNEKKIFNYLWNNVGEDEAVAYVKGKDARLKQQSIADFYAEMYEMGKEHPWLTLASNVLTAPQRGVIALGATADTLISGSDDPSLAQITTKATQYGKSGGAEGSGSPFWYNVGTSAGEEGMLSLTTAGIGGLAGRFANSALHYGTAFESKYNEYKDAGYSEAESKKAGLTAAGIESLSEMIFDNPLNRGGKVTGGSLIKGLKSSTKTQILKNIAKAGLEEGTEELVSALGEEMYDAVTNHEKTSTFLQVYNDRIEKGNSETSAITDALLAVSGDALEDVASGFLVGSFLSGSSSYSNVKTATQMRQYAGEILAPYNNSFETVRSFMISEMGMENNAETRKIAQAIFDYSNGKTISPEMETSINDNPYFRGLTYAMVDKVSDETDKQINPLGNTVNVEPEITETKSRDYKTEMYNMLTGENLSVSAIDSIISDKNMVSAFEELTGTKIKGTKAEQRNIVRDFQNDAQNIEDLNLKNAGYNTIALTSAHEKVNTLLENVNSENMGKIIKSETLSKAYEELTGTALNGTMAEKKAIIREGAKFARKVYAESVKADRGTIRQSMYRDVNEVGVETVSETENVSEKPKRAYFKKADAESVKSGIENVNADEQFANIGRSGSKVYSNFVGKDSGLVKKFVKAGMRINSAQTMADSIFQFMYDAGKRGTKLEVAVGAMERIHPGIKEYTTAFYYAGVNDTNLMVGKKGAKITENDVIKRMRESKKLDGNTEKAINTIAKKIGLNITFVSKEELGEGNNGSFNLKTGEIKINEDSEIPYVVAVMHESIHAIRSIAPKNYNELADLVFELITKDSEVFGESWKHIRDLYREQITDKDGNVNKDLINEEYVANVVSTLLFDKQFVNDLAKEDMGFVQKIFKAIKDLFDKILGRYNTRAKTDAELNGAVKLLKSEFDRIEGIYESALSATESVQTDKGKASEVGGVMYAKSGLTSGKNNGNIKENGDQYRVMWTIEEGIMDKRDVANFYTQIANFRKRDHKNYHVSQDGEYIFAVNNKLVYTDGDYIYPEITKVISFESEYENEINDLREVIFDGEEQSSLETSFAIIEAIKGEGFVTVSNFENSRAYERQIRGRKGKNSGTSDSRSGEDVELNSKSPTQSATDAEYLELAKNPEKNEARLREMVDEAAVNSGVDTDSNGKPISAYHGTPHFGFTSVDTQFSDDNLSFWATTDVYVANSYDRGTNSPESSIRKIGNPQENAKTPKLDIKTHSVEEIIDKVTEIFPEYKDYKSAIILSDKQKLKKSKTSISRALKIAKKLLKSSEINSNDSDIINNFINAVDNKNISNISNATDIFGKRISNGSDSIYEERMDTFLDLLSDIHEIVRPDYVIMNGEVEFLGHIISRYNAETGHSGIYEMYYKVENPYIIDCKGVQWNQIEAPAEISPNGEKMSTREIAMWAFEHGYDSVKYLNAVDMGSKKSEKKSAVVWAFLNPSKQLWSADTVTYDDNGNIIPLSERFSDSNDDLRYSKSPKRTSKLKDITPEYVRGEVTRDFESFKKLVIETMDEEIAKAKTKPTVTKVSTPTTAEIVENSTYIGDDGQKVTIVPEGTPGAKKVYISSDYQAVEKPSERARTGEPAKSRVPLTALRSNAINNKHTKSVIDLLKNDDSFGTYFKFTDEAALVEAERRYEEKGYKGMLESWKNTMESGVFPTKQTSTDGAFLLKKASEHDDGDAVIYILSELQPLITNSAQIVQSVNILARKLSGESRAYMAVKSLKKLESRIRQKKGNEGVTLEFPKELVNEYIKAVNYELGMSDTSVNENRNSADSDVLQSKSGKSELKTFERKTKKLEKRIEEAHNKKVKFNISDSLKNEYVSSVDMEKNTGNSSPYRSSDEILADMWSAVAEQLPTSWAETFNLWRYASMLMSPATHLSNVFSNYAHYTNTLSKNIYASLIEAMVIRDKNKRTKSIGASFKSLAPGILRKKFDKLYRFAVDDAQKIQNDLKGDNKYDVDKTSRSKFKIVEKIGEGIFGALKWEDWVMMRGHYARALSSFMQARGYKPSTITETQLDEGRKIAIEEARRATFNETNAFSQMLKEAARKNKVVDFVIGSEIPFAKVPANVLETGVDYSPLGFVRTIGNIFNKDIDANTKIDMLARNLTGTQTYVLGAMLFAAGILSVSGDDEEPEEKLYGAQKYSINFGGKSWSLDWMAPAGIALFAGAQFWHDVTADGEEFEIVDLIKAIPAIGESTMNILFDMTMLENISYALKSAQYGDSFGESVADFVSSTVFGYLGQFIPTPVGQIAKSIDNTKRGTYIDKNSKIPSYVQVGIQQLVRKIPFLYSKLEPTINEHGEPEKNSVDNVVLRTIDNLILPGSLKKLRSNEIDDELMRLYKEAPDGKDALPKKLAKHIGEGDERKDLTAKEYARMQTVFGQTYYGKLKEIIGTDYYDNLSDENKVKLLKKVKEYATEKAKDEVDSRFRPDTWLKISMETPGVYQYIIDTEPSESFNVDDLNDEQYESFKVDKSDMVSNILGQYTPDNSDYDFADKYYDYLNSFTKEVALEKNSGGEYEIDTKWINTAKNMNSRKQSEFIYAKALTSGLSGSEANEVLKNNSFISSEVKAHLQDFGTHFSQTPASVYESGGKGGKNLNEYNISMDVFVDVFNTKENLKEYKDSNGKTVSVQKQICEYIGGLNISDAEKSALYRVWYQDKNSKGKTTIKDVTWNYVWE